MWKKNKWALLLSSLVILLPAVVGLILWDQLPAQITTHWGGDGAADGWSGRGFAVFGIPLLLLVLHWVCLWITDKDNKGRNEKMRSLVVWILPVLSLTVNGVMYALALEKTFDGFALLCALMGLMLVVIGNYLPKCKQNRTMGIKISWTLSSEENWNVTHRVAGWCWVAGGVVVLLCALLPMAIAQWICMGVMLLAILVPVVYSGLYYKKQVKAGTAPEKAQIPVSKGSKIVLRILLPVLLVGIAILMLVGEVQVQCAETSFTVSATFYDSVTVEYTQIDEITYREDCPAGSRISGFGSPRLSLGQFQNEEFGNYLRYSYTGCKACVVLKSDGKVMVITGKDAQSTRQIYEALLEKMQ